MERELRSCLISFQIYWKQRRAFAKAILASISTSILACQIEFGFYWTYLLVQYARRSRNICCCREFGLLWRPRTTLKKNKSETDWLRNLIYYPQLIVVVYPKVLKLTCSSATSGLRPDSSPNSQTTLLTRYFFTAKFYFFQKYHPTQAARWPWRSSLGVKRAQLHFVTKLALFADCVEINPKGLIFRRQCIFHKQKKQV